MKGSWKLQPWKALGIIPLDLLNPRHLQKDHGDRTAIYVRLHQKKINLIWRWTWSIAITVSAFCWSAFSFYMDVTNLEPSGLDNWFAPSGAIIVFAAIWLEYCMNRITQYQQTEAEGHIVHRTMGDAKKILYYFDFLEKVVIASLIAGTKFFESVLKG